MLVSVIIPTYYRNDRLSWALDSVQNQSHDQIEVIVVDDSGEKHAAQEVSDSAIYIPHGTNRGAHAARDTGLQNASGKYIQFLDDDDVLFPTKLEKQVERLSSSDRVGVVYCGLEHEDGKTHSCNQEVKGDILEDALRFYDHPLTTSTMLIDANVLERIQPLHRDSKGADDIRMTIELAQITEFDFVDEILVTAGRPENSRGASWGGVEGRWNILQDYKDLYEEAPTEVKKEALTETYQLQGRRHLEDHIWSPSAIYSFAQALRYAPEITPLHIGEFLSSFAGRPGRGLARWLF